MRKADKIKLSMIVGVSLLAFIVGCVDTAVQPLPTSIDYRSQVSVVNLAAGAGTATVGFYASVLDHDSLAVNILSAKYDFSKAVFSGSADFGFATPTSTYQDIPAGGKAIIVSYTSAVTDTFIVSTETDYKMRFYIINDATGRKLIKVAERYIWQTPGSTEGSTLFPSGSGWLKVFNGSPDAGTVSVKIEEAATDTTYQAAFNVDSAKTSLYSEFSSSNSYNIIVTAGTTVDTVAFAPGSQKRYTAIVYDAAASLKVKVLTDD